MKVRIGVAAGARVAEDPAALFTLVDALEDLGYDSLWVPDVVTTPTLDPIAALAAAAGRRPKLKLGTHLIVPGRNPVLLARQLASLDRLSGGRLLLMAVIGLRRPDELAAQGVDAGDRTTMLEESLEVMRALWRGERVTFAGRHVCVDDVALGIRPVQDPLEVWLGGMVPAALRRCGRLGEGWMPGLCTPAEAERARLTIEAEAELAGRRIDAEHFGVNLTFVTGTIDDRVRAAIAARRTDLAAEDVVAVGPAGLADRVKAFLDVGFSKFVIRPTVEPASWTDAVESVSEVLELQS
ncbi:MAG: LLM class flavin-dependent oxidoreductase [Actinomycetota bacterium]